jgi:hypothetical protein
MPAAGPDQAAPGYRGGDIVNTFTSRDVETADELALARLDDDGAPPPVTWPQAGDNRDAIRRGQPRLFGRRPAPRQPATAPEQARAGQPAPDGPAGAPAPDVPAGAPAPAE